MLVEGGKDITYHTLIFNYIIFCIDLIKINLGEKAAADVSCLDYRQKFKIKEKWDFCLKKGEVFNGFENSLNDTIELEGEFQLMKYDKL